MKAFKNYSILLSSIFLLLLAGTALVLAAPTAPQTLNKGVISTFDENNYASQEIDAQAGNITAVTLTAITQTRGWQGYYGNVSGYITLDDANNYTFYNWSVAEPVGQVYASLQSAGTVSWSNVVCMNFTAASANTSNFNTKYNFSANDYDNVTNTYNLTNHPTFYIDERAISGCPTTYVFQDDAYQTNNFPNFLLMDEARAGTDGWVFGTVLEDRDAVGTTKPDLNCYNGGKCDFQLLVAENGHGTDNSLTQYFFWVDLTG